jgi:glyoxylase-like metal-dependent hydrolase (beta-lactamase superfamily II)
MKDNPKEVCKNLLRVLPWEGELEDRSGVETRGSRGGGSLALFVAQSISGEVPDPLRLSLQSRKDQNERNSVLRQVPRSMIVNLLWLTLIAFGFFSPRKAAAIDRDYSVRQLAPYAYAWIPDDVMDQNGDPRYSRAANVGFAITDQGVVVIDTTNNPLHARDVLYEIRQRTNMPVRLIIDTGPEADQVLGNEVFAEQHAQIISTVKAAGRIRSYQQAMASRVAGNREMIERMRGIHITLPNRTFDGTMSFTMGDQPIRIISLPCAVPGESSGDAAVFLPKARVVFLGDLFVDGYVPRIGSRDIRRWIAVLGKVETWNATTFIPAHGAPATRQDVERFRGLLEWLQWRVQGGIRQGKSLMDVERELLDSKTLYLRAPELAPSAIADVYEQLLKPSKARTSRAARANADSALRAARKALTVNHNY